MMGSDKMMISIFWSIMYFIEADCPKLSIFGKYMETGSKFGKAFDVVMNYLKTKKKTPFIYFVDTTLYINRDSYIPQKKRVELAQKLINVIDHYGPKIFYKRYDKDTDLDSITNFSNISRACYIKMIDNEYCDDIILRIEECI